MLHPPRNKTAPYITLLEAGWHGVRNLMPSKESLVRSRSSSPAAAAGSASSLLRFISAPAIGAPLLNACEISIQDIAVYFTHMCDGDVRVFASGIEQKLSMSGAGCGYARAVSRGGIAVLGQLSTRAILWPLNKRAQRLQAFTRRNKRHLV